MNIRLEKKDKCLADLEIEVPAEAVADERKKVVKAFMAQARIPGFRPGKAPISVIEKSYGEEITNELTSRLIQNSYQDAMKENEELRVLQTGNPQDVQLHDEGHFSYKAELTLAPEFELPEYKGLSIDMPKAGVTDEMVDDQLQQLRQRFADYEDIADRAAEKGDLVVMDYTSTIDGKPLDEVGGEQAKPLAANEGYWIKVEDEAFFPGFTDALIGTKPGDEKEITVTLPEDFPIETIREKEAVFAVKVKELKSENMPELDDDLASKVEPGKTLEDLRGLINDNLKARQERELNELKVNMLLDKLANSVDFDLPEAYLQAETQGQADAMVREGMEAGMNEEEVEARKAELFDEAQGRATNTLKTNFLLTNIADAEKVEVNNEEIMQRVAMAAKQEKKQVKNMLKEMRKDGRLNSIRQNLIFSKAIDILIDSANVTEVEPETEE